MDRDSLTGAGERGRQIGPRHADETAALCLVQRRQIHMRFLAAVAIDHLQPLHFITAFAQRRDDAHALRDLVPESPEVDEVPACSNRRRLLEEHRIVPRPSKPVGECRASDAHAVDGDSHVGSPFSSLFARSGPHSSPAPLRRPARARTAPRPEHRLERRGRLHDVQRRIDETVEQQPVQ